MRFLHIKSLRATTCSGDVVANSASMQYGLTSVIYLVLFSRRAFLNDMVPTLFCDPQRIVQHFEEDCIAIGFSNNSQGHIRAKHTLLHRFL